MKYSIFSAPGSSETLLEWGGASVRPRAEIFLRGGGVAGAICPLCVCVCTGKAIKIGVFEPGFLLVSLIWASKWRLLHQKKSRELRYHRTFQGRSCFAKRAGMRARAAIPIYGNLAANLD